MPTGGKGVLYAPTIYQLLSFLFPCCCALQNLKASLKFCYAPLSHSTHTNTHIQYKHEPFVIYTF